MRKGPPSYPLSKQSTAPATRCAGSRAWPGGESTGSPWGSRQAQEAPVRATALEPALPWAAAWAPWARCGTSAGAPRAGRGPCWPPVPASPRCACTPPSGSRSLPNRPGRSSDPLRPLRGGPVASPERPLDWSASRNLSPRTWCRARRVLRSRSALGD